MTSFVLISECLWKSLYSKSKDLNLECFCGLRINDCRVSAINRNCLRILDIGKKRTICQYQLIGLHYTLFLWAQVKVFWDNFQQLLVRARIRNPEILIQFRSCFNVSEHLRQQVLPRNFWISNTPCSELLLSVRLLKGAGAFYDFKICTSRQLMLNG